MVVEVGTVSPYGEAIERVRAAAKEDERRTASADLLEQLHQDVVLEWAEGPSNWCAAFDASVTLRDAGRIERLAWWKFLDGCVDDVRDAAGPLTAQGEYVVFCAIRLQRDRYSGDLETLSDRLATGGRSSGPFRVWALAQAAEGPRRAGDYAAAIRWLGWADAAAALKPLRDDGVDARAGRTLLFLQRANLHTELGQHAEALRQASRAAALLATIERVDGLSPRTDWLVDQVKLTRAAALSANGLHRAVQRALDDSSIESAGAPYRPHLRWFCAVAHARLGETEQARAALSELVGPGGLRGLDRGLVLLERILLELDAGRNDAALELALEARAHCEEHPEFESQVERQQALEAFARWRTSGQTEDRDRALEVARRAMDRFIERGLAVPVDDRAEGMLTYDLRRVVPAILVSLLLEDSDAEAGRVAALDALLELEQFGVLGRRLGAPLATVDDVRASLLSEDGDGLLFYFPAWRSCHLFALTRTTLVHAELPGLATMRRTLGEARLALTDPTVRADEPALVLASRTILPADVLEEMKGWSRATIVGAALLQHAPFAALPVSLGPEGADVPLGLAMPLTELPSCSVGLALNARPVRTAASSGDRIVVGDGAAASELARFGLGPVSFTEGAAERLGRATLVSGPTARLRGNDQRPRTLTVFAHGVLDPLRARPTGVLLPGGEDGGPLFAGDVEAAWPGSDAPPVVVLAACGAGMSPLRVGDDDSSTLGAAFLEAGSSCVLASPVALEQKATSFLVAAFLEALNDGEGDTSPSEALLRARRALAADDSFKGPHDWATLGVVGLGHAPAARR